MSAAPHQHQHAPNHHAHHPAFRGVRGLVGALSMARGRSIDGELVVRLTAVARGGHAVDVGAGPGSAARAAARSGVSVTAVDPAAVMRRVGRLLTWTRRVRFVSGVAESLPMADAVADAVWSIASV